VEKSPAGNKAGDAGHPQRNPENILTVGVKTALHPQSNPESLKNKSTRRDGHRTNRAKVSSSSYSGAQGRLFLT